MAAKRTKPEQETPKIDVTEVPEEIPEVPGNMENPEPGEPKEPEEPAEEAPKKKYGPIDYVEKAIQLLEAEPACHEYETALKMLDGARIFINKKGG